MTHPDERARMKAPGRFWLTLVAVTIGALVAAPAALAATVPGAPRSVTAVAGDASAVVSWLAPSSDGDSPITSYTVTSSPGNRTATTNGAGRSATVTGLTNGTAYTFTVTATNAEGTGPASAPAPPVTPATVPSAPRNPSATAGDRSATVRWSAPSSTGGATITAYQVTATPGGAVVTTSGSARSATVSNLTNGIAYTFTVTATNAAGTGPASAATAPVTPNGVPGAPTNVAAVAGDERVTVTWSPPTTTGGSAISSYTVTASPGGRSASTNGSGRSATVTGLTNGTAYTFTVRATNSQGTGPAASPPAAVTPYGEPRAPTGVTATAGDRSATVRWTAPSANGSPITSYRVTASPGTRTATVGGSTTTATVTGLTNGTSYTFRVTATNARGTGPASAPSNSVRPAAINEVRRLAGSSRIGTAIALSEDNWATAATGATATRSLAQAVVLTRADSFADALAATPLAARKIGPLLLTPPTQLDAAVRNEILRILSPGRTVYILGGTAAVSAGTESILRADGYTVVRLAGANRFATAVQVADVGLGNPSTQFLVTGLNFPDALAAGAAAARAGGSVLLTNGRLLEGSTLAYLNSHAGTRYTIGGPATEAYPSGVAVVGADRFDTAVRVARRFFTAPGHVGVAAGRSFPDALSGSAHVAARGGPLLLVSDTLPPVVRAYLVEQRDAVSYAAVYGGPILVTDQVLNDIRVAMT
jgi:putative cell wall-binding protein